MPWIITGVLAIVVGLIVWTEVRCGRRYKVFQAKIEPEIDALKTSVLTKYRERFGKDPTEPFLTVSEPKSQGRFAKKS